MRLYGFKPQAAEAAYWLGRLSCLRLQYEEEIKYFQHAVELQPRNSRYIAELQNAEQSAAQLR